MACVLKGQDDGSWSVSLRSRGGTDVARVAMALGGGGHARPPATAPTSTARRPSQPSAPSCAPMTGNDHGALTTSPAPGAVTAP